jgi:DNA ligase D-like protein (predicted ligase)
MAARLVQRLPEGAAWSYEVKFDGYRALIIKDADHVRIRSRNDKDLTGAYPAVVAAALRLKATQAVVDGEIVALDAEGHPSFQALQHRAAHPRHQIAYYAFDLLHLDGIDLTGTPLGERRAALAATVGRSGLLLSRELPGTADDVIAAVRALKLEGVIAKRNTSTYTPGERSQAWQKLKLEQQQEFVVGGFRPGPNGVDALLVGYYDGGELRFAAKVTAGFTPRLRQDVLARLRPLQVARCPFSGLPSSKSDHWGAGITKEQMLEMVWVKPARVVQVRFVEWTADGHLRHAAFLGWRPDKQPAEVRRET